MRRINQIDKQLTVRQMKLVRDNLRLIYRVLRNKVNEQNREDAFQACIFGLMRAAQKYNPKIAKFSTYAFRWINHAYLYWRSKQSIIAIPHRYFAPIMNPDKEYNMREWVYQREAKAALDMTFITIPKNDESPMDVPYRGESTITSAGKQEIISIVFESMKKLPERERRILQLRHIEGVILPSIAKEMGLTKERVRQLEHKAILKLRKHLQMDLPNENPGLFGLVD